MDKREYEKVICLIKERIAAGTLKQGERLPTERSLAGELGMSRTSVREALRSMENMGLVESRQGSGNYLTADIGKTLSQSLELMLLVQRTTYEDISSLRCALELYAFEQAILHVTQAQLERFDRLLEEMQKKEIEEVISLDREFHYTIIEASGKQLMMQVMQAIAASCESNIELVLKSGDEGLLAELAGLHEEIVISLKQKDVRRGTAAIRHHYERIDKAAE